MSSICLRDKLRCLENIATSALASRQPVIPQSIHRGIRGIAYRGQPTFSVVPARRPTASNLARSQHQRRQLRHKSRMTESSQYPLSGLWKPTHLERLYVSARYWSHRETLADKHSSDTTVPKASSGTFSRAYQASRAKPL